MTEILKAIGSVIGAVAGAALLLYGLGNTAAIIASITSGAVLTATTLAAVVACLIGVGYASSKTGSLPT